MASFAEADFYSDHSLVEDPHSYFDFLRGQGPVTRLPYRNVVAVTGYEETIQVMLDTEHFFEHQRGGWADPRSAVYATG